MWQEKRIAEYTPALGLYATYVRDAKRSAVCTPERLEKIKAEVGALKSDDEAAKTPTVIFLMSESFFDVTKLDGVTFAEDPISNFRRLSEECTSGEFISSAYCGGTGTVEMEVMTGICSYHLKESQSVTNLMPRSKFAEIPVITDVFKDYGYSTTFIHSYNSNLYNRSITYDYFGFDKVMFDEDFPEGTEYKGGYISDKALSDNIISLFENKGDKPMFLLGVSMENHQPFLKDKYGDEKFVEVSSNVLDEEQLAWLQTYVNGVYDADKALGYLTDYFEKVDEDVMIVFFGDHLPNLIGDSEETVYSRTGYVSSEDSMSWTPQELSKMLTTDYLIWTNYEEEPLPDKTESSIFLGLSVMERLGFKLNDYYAWVSEYIKPEMLMSRSSLFVDGSGNAYNTPPDSHSELNKKFAAAIYDMVYGKNDIFKK